MHSSVFFNLNKQNVPLFKAFKWSFFMSKASLQSLRLPLKFSKWKCAAALLVNNWTFNKSSSHLMSSPMVYSVIALRYFLALNSLFPLSLCLRASLPLFSRFRFAIVLISEGNPPEIKVVIIYDWWYFLKLWQMITPHFYQHTKL